MKRYIFAGVVIFAAMYCSAKDAKIEDFFPKGIELEVKRKPLSEEKRTYLKTFGVSDEVLDLYGDIYVDSYSCEDFRWGDLRPDDLGSSPIDPKDYDLSGLKKFGALPPAGVHPRILFSDADREGHLKRLTTTKGGKEAMKIINGYSAHLKGEYDKTADYASPDTWHGSFGTTGFLELFRARCDGWESRSQGISEGQLSPGLCVIEAYRCWLYQDKEGMKKVITAYETLVREGLEKLAAGDKGVRLSDIGGFNTSYFYDLTYNYMTKEQRKLFSSVIIAAWFARNNYGMFQNAENTTSNWTTFGYQFFGRLGIEGDPGYNEIAYLGWKRAMMNYFTYGWFKGGTCFEAFGKNQLGGDIMYGMAMRGDNIAAHPHVLACLKDYMPHAILPWGGEYIAYDRWGGVKALNLVDIMPMKNLFPDDKKVDWVYRNAVGEDYSLMLQNNRVDGWGNNAFKTVVFAVDYDEANNDISKLMDTESFIDPQRGLMITRSDWNKDALYMQVHSRGHSGGHVFADRSSFLLAGLGRMWVPNGALSYRSSQNSVVTIDGLEASDKSPARLTNYKRTPMATFCTTDLRPTWNYFYARLTRDGEAEITIEAANAAIEAENQNQDRHFNLFKMDIDLCKESFNDMALEKEDKQQFKYPQFAKPHWLKPNAVTGLLRKTRELQFSKAFRTAGMVRGDKGVTNSYVLIVDDWKAIDSKNHTYDWRARIAPDLLMISHNKYSINQNNGRKQRPGYGDTVYTDILLASSADVEHQAMNKWNNYERKLKKGSKVMLVRVLEKNIPERTHWSNPHIQPVDEGIRVMQTGDATANRLMIKAITKEPRFKVLFYVTETKDGNNGLKDEPVTIWDNEKEKLTIKIGEQEDLISFEEAPEQPTTFTIKRKDGEEFSYGLDDYNSE